MLGLYLFIRSTKWLLLARELLLLPRELLTRELLARELLARELLLLLARELLLLLAGELLLLAGELLLLPRELLTRELLLLAGELLLLPRELLAGELLLLAGELLTGELLLRVLHKLCVSIRLLAISPTGNRQHVAHFGHAIDDALLLKRGFVRLGGSRRWGPMAVRIILYHRRGIIVLRILGLDFLNIDLKEQGTVGRNTIPRALGTIT